MKEVGSNWASNPRYGKVQQLFVYVQREEIGHNNLSPHAVMKQCETLSGKQAVCL
jgi:hypothetical protein